MDVREKLVEICFHEFCMVAGDSPCGCDGCPYGKYGSDDGECYEEYKKDKMAKLEKAGVTVQDWTSVNDRFPEDNERVIAYRPNEPETSAYKYCVMWGWSVKSSLKHRGITHWMPLPQPPKGE